jgi:hypothetical protein
MRSLVLFSLCLLTGCATHSRSVRARPAAPLGQGVATKDTPRPVTVVETRYDIAGYRDSADPAVWHESHAILRATVVPGRSAPSVAESGALTAYVPASYDPLPPSAELAAVLSEQRQITAELRALKAKMFALQGQAQAQYGSLVAETAETDHLRQQLSAEEARLKAREASSATAASVAGSNW